MARVDTVDLTTFRFVLICERLSNSEELDSFTHEIVKVLP